MATIRVLDKVVDVGSIFDTISRRMNGYIVAQDADGRAMHGKDINVFSAVVRLKQDIPLISVKIYQGLGSPKAVLELNVIKGFVVLREDTGWDEKITINIPTGDTELVSGNPDETLGRQIEYCLKEGRKMYQKKVLDYAYEVFKNISKVPISKPEL